MIGEARDEIHWQHAEATDTALVEAQTDVPKEDARRMGWITKTGEYLSVLHSTINGAELGVQEWRDFLFLCYGIDNPNLPDHCNEYGAAFYICHSLDRKK